MILQLPLELWNIISDFLQPESLSQVCQSLREVLGSGCHLKVKCNADQIEQCVIGYIGNLRLLKFRGYFLQSSGVQALAALKEAITVRQCRGLVDHVP